MGEEHWTGSQTPSRHILLTPRSNSKQCLFSLGACRGRADLVQRSPTVLRTTQTGNLLVLNRELVVVRDLLIDVNSLSGVDHNFLLRLHRYDLCITVRLKEKMKYSYTFHVNLVWHR